MVRDYEHWGIGSNTILKSKVKKYNPNTLIK
jgi:hypothetical protein